MVKKWIALFSRTGSELDQICEALGFTPNTIFTNNQSTTIAFPKLVITKPETIYELIRQAYYTDEVFITLHGYMKIIPEWMCNQFNIFNGHPGAIDIYPILKGKDPQKKAIELEIPFTYNVIHRVTPGVDEGEILAKSSVVPILPEDNEVYISNILRREAIPMWVDFIKGVRN